MANISSGIWGDANLIDLSAIPISQVRPEVNGFLVDGEQILQCFKTVRDQVVFTNKRVIVVNVQGITGKKVAYFTFPYSKVQYFGVETAGFLDVDSELVLVFSDGNRLQFDFAAKVDVRQICAEISACIL